MIVRLKNFMIIFILCPIAVYCQQIDIVRLANLLDSSDIENKGGMRIEKHGNGRFGLRWYNQFGRTDGLWINIRSDRTNKYRISHFGYDDNGMTMQAFIFNDDGSLAYTVDSVQPLNIKMFPNLDEVAKICTHNDIGKYGIVQYYIKIYDHHLGTISDEGWYCALLEKDNSFDFEIDPLPIGIHKHYLDDRIILTDETSSTIQMLLNMAGCGDD